MGHKHMFVDVPARFERVRKRTCPCSCMVMRPCSTTGAHLEAELGARGDDLCEAKVKGAVGQPARLRIKRLEGRLEAGVACGSWQRGGAGWGGRAERGWARVRVGTQQQRALHCRPQTVLPCICTQSSSTAAFLGVHWIS